MLDESTREDLIEQIKAIFTNEADAEAFNEDPDGYVAEHLPEGVDGADVASCLPEVGYRTGLDFSNVASTGGGASAAGQISHTYETIYQQNSFIYAEEGAQVTNIQGDGNAVAQQDIDIDVDLDDEDYGEGDDDGEIDIPVEEPVDEVDEPGTEVPELPVEEPVDEAPMDEPVEDPWTDELPEEPVETPVEEAPEAPMEPEVPDGAEAL